ncbi:quinolinate synthase NadA [Paludicola sp. MB14-C6]|uniref:quinolinate synthase NadA n=1 Tax=Paludihabitans sp. MB14-C6 TaxID=3070656 RepID=UPI0027DE9B7D|nr:quinolinate synthase NadA [Paludicola sp. MB14-C6]WMJ23854.1 quinolinate synthase NadA [Paludicola sp. MB14-C6]
MIKDLQEQIIKLKQEKDFYILAHSYQAKEIVEVADFTGDSFQLSLAAQKVPNKNILLCGVHFMAETVKMLSPEKNVYLANPIAGCPMAEQLEPEMIEYLKKQNPDYTVVAYINTTANLKSVSDVCVTSSSAVKIVNNIENNNILFIPDCNLGDYISKQLPHKNIKLVQGGCPVHAAVTEQDIINAKAAHPNAKALVHPECTPAVLKHADYIGSTSGIVEYAMKSDCREFIIGTEMSIAEHLQYACPEKDFYILSKKILCPNMKLTTLVDVFKTLNGTGGLEIQMSDETIAKARVCVDEMIRLGK